MSNHIHKITFPPEEDDFFLELRNQVNNYFKSSGKSIYGDTVCTKIALLLIVFFIVFNTINPRHRTIIYFTMLLISRDMGGVFGS